MPRWPAYILCFGAAALANFFVAGVAVNLFWPLGLEGRTLLALIPIGLAPPLVSGSVFALGYAHWRAGAGLLKLWLGSVVFALVVWGAVLGLVMQGYVTVAEGAILALTFGFGVGVGLSRQWELAA